MAREVGEPLPFEYRLTSSIGSIEVLDLIDHLRRNSEGKLCRLVIAGSSLLTGSGQTKKIRLRQSDALTG